MTIKFNLLPCENADKAHYQYTSIALAEGFKELGIDYFGNIDYWYEEKEGDYLIHAGNKQADVNIYSTQFIRQNTSEKLASLNHKAINVLIDADDKLHTPALEERFTKFNLILRCHYTHDLPYGPHVKPWAFGCANRIINSINSTLDKPVERRAIISYRLFHDFRKLTNEKFLPTLSNCMDIYHFQSQPPPEVVTKNINSYWSQTGKRHYEDYFGELNASLLGLCFGGTHSPNPLPLNTKTRVQNLLTRLKLIMNAKAATDTRNYMIIQWDSWRFWETMLSNACAVFIDFDEWRLGLPEFPLAGEHFLAVHGFNFKQSANNICSMSDKEIQQIAARGREWTLQHYSPKAVANRFINYVEAL